MAGVIDKNGVAWEPCNKCGKYVRFEELWYHVPFERHEFGLDLCVNCVDLGLQSQEFKFDDVFPGGTTLILTK